MILTIVDSCPDGVRGIIYDLVYEYFYTDDYIPDHPDIWIASGIYFVSVFQGGTFYTQRPDGSWYCLTYVAGCGKFDSKTLYNLLQSGLEPYQAFEVLAL